MNRRWHLDSSLHERVFKVREDLSRRGKAVLL